MATVISIANQKGGVAKTTTTVHFGAGLAGRGFKTLLIDFDPQASLTCFFGNIPGTYKYVGDWIMDRSSFEDVVRPTGVKNLDLIPSHEGLKDDEFDMQKDYLKALDYLGSKVNEILEKYDFILIDNLPALSLLGLNGMIAGQFILIPTKLDYISINGLAQLVKRISDLKKKKPIEVLGIVATSFRAVLEHEKRLDELRITFPNKVFNTAIRQTVRLDEAAGTGQTIQAYEPDGIGAMDYNKLTEEILQRCQMNINLNPVA